MAKFTIIYENGEIRKELEFRGEKYGYTMRPCKLGMQGDGPSISTQFEEKNICDDETLEYLDDLDFGDEDTIQEALEYLTDNE